MSDGLLLIHAFPLDGRMWEGQRLGATTLAPDLPGFGVAARPVGTMTMAAAAAHCLRIADAAGLERFVVCGLSMGGYVTFELWRQARDRIAGLVLANTRAGADTPRRLAAGVTSLSACGRRATSWPRAHLRYSPRMRPRSLERVKGWIADQSAEAIAAAALGMAERPDSTADLAGIDVPTW